MVSSIYAISLNGGSGGSRACCIGRWGCVFKGLISIFCKLLCESIQSMRWENLVHTLVFCETKVRAIVRHTWLLTLIFNNFYRVNMKFCLFYVYSYTLILIQVRIFHNAYTHSSLSGKELIRKCLEFRKIFLCMLLSH